MCYLLKTDLCSKWLDEKEKEPITTFSRKLLISSWATNSSELLDVNGLLDSYWLDKSKQSLAIQFS